MQQACDDMLDVLCDNRRCWNYSTQVGHDAEHAQLCERCSPVIRGMGFALPSNGVAAAAAVAEPAQAAVTL